LIARGKPKDGATPEAAMKFLAAIEKSDVTFYEAIGYGVEHRIVGKTVVGSALTLANAVIHLSLLSAKQAKPRKSR
jgi:hypothetical protein